MSVPKQWGQYPDFIRKERLNFRCWSIITPEGETGQCSGAWLISGGPELAAFFLKEKTQKTLSTLRYRVFAVGAYFEKQNDVLKLKISPIKKRRKWFASLWDYPIALSKKISIA